jgi:hypothetical protein
MVHISETCEPPAPPLLTHVHTPPAPVHEAQGTRPIHQALIEQALPPRAPLVDAAYSSAPLLVDSGDDHGIMLRGPTRPTQGWQRQVAGAYTIEQCPVDGERPQGGGPRARGPPVGTSAWSRMARPTSSPPSAGKTVMPVPPVRSVPRPSSRAAGGACRPKTSTRPSPPPAPGTPGRRVSRPISSVRVSQGHSPRGGARLGCGARGIGADPKPISSTSRLPPPSRSIGLGPGWRSSHGRRRGPRAALRSRPPAPYPRGRHLRRHPLTCLAPCPPPKARAKTLFYYRKHIM